MGSASKKNDSGTPCSTIYVSHVLSELHRARSNQTKIFFRASLARASPTHPQPSHEAPSPKLVHALSADAEWRFRFYVAPRINLGWNLEAFSFTVLQTCTALVSSRLLPFHCLLQVLLFLLSASSHFRRAPHKPCSLHPTHAATNSNHPNPNRHLGLSDHSNFSAPSGPPPLCPPCMPCPPPLPGSLPPAQTRSRRHRQSHPCPKGLPDARKTCDES